MAIARGAVADQVGDVVERAGLAAAVALGDRAVHLVLERAGLARRPPASWRSSRCPPSLEHGDDLRGLVRSERDRPEPSLSWGWTPKLAISDRTTAAPAAVVPAPPKLAPSPLSSISAKKLSDGVLVSLISVAIRGEWTTASCCAEAGVTARVHAGLPRDLDPAAFSARRTAGWRTAPAGAGTRSLLVGEAAVVDQRAQLALDPARGR